MKVHDAGFNWTITASKLRFLSLPPRISEATSMWRTSVFDASFCPDALSLGHESWHIENTNTFHYLVSISIGRLWGSTYWRDQEIAANTHGRAVQNDPKYLALASAVRAAYTASYGAVPTGTYSHLNLS